MQFRRQCRLRAIPISLVAVSRTPGGVETCPASGSVTAPVDQGCASRSAWRGIALSLALLGLAGPASAGAAPLRLAQLGPNTGPGPSYGYQPYNDRNPTGFFHPNGTGYGQYYLTQKHHAPRFRALRARKFRGT